MPISIPTATSCAHGKPLADGNRPSCWLANPNYGFHGLSGCSFEQLSRTATEADAIAQILPDARALTGSAATKAVLQTVHGPRILFLGTHAFFPDNMGKGPDGCRPGPVRAGECHDLVAWSLLRSGHILAGGNENRQTGLLTAFEAAEMDLHGTEWSSCRRAGPGCG